MPQKIAPLLSGAVLAGLLAGCGGGGGISDDSAVAVPFGAFVGPSRTVSSSGVSATAAGTHTVSGGTSTIQSRALHGISTTGSAQVTFNQDSKATAASLSAPASSASSPALSCAAGLCGAGTPPTVVPGSDIALVDATVHGWHYQTFGIWANRPTVSNWQTGAMSMGNATPGSAVPTSGSGLFTGRAMGQYADAAGTPFTTFAEMNANVNFASRSIGFSTTGTLLHNQNTGVETANTGLNLSGTLSYGPGINQFSGPVNTANGQLSGQAGGRFYGPNAQEIGGVFSLGGTGPSHMVGGFGGRRP